jgi:cellulase
MQPKALLIPLFSLLPTSSAHARITQVTTPTNTSYPGWDPTLALSSSQPPPLVAWRAANLGNIFVPPSHFNTSDIACHFNATPGQLSIPATAGDVLTLQWNEWPVSHKGPILSYLAACPEAGCSHADKEKLEWVKIAELGWLDASDAGGVQGLNGTWASDVLIANRASWRVRVPEKLRGGGYVLRHEIIALHVAEQVGGAQAYPQCVNLDVGKSGKGDGEKLGAGVLARELYGVTDKGILVDIHGDVEGYEIPGPKVWEGADEVRQPGQAR